MTLNAASTSRTRRSPTAKQGERRQHERRRSVVSRSTSSTTRRSPASRRARRSTARRASRSTPPARVRRRRRPTAAPPPAAASWRSAVAITLANVTTAQPSLGPRPDALTGGGLTAKRLRRVVEDDRGRLAAAFAEGGGATIGLSLSLAIINDLVDSRPGATSRRRRCSELHREQRLPQATLRRRRVSAGAPGKKSSTQGSDDGATNPQGQHGEGTVQPEGRQNLSLANGKSTSSSGQELRHEAARPPRRAAKAAACR